MKEKKNVKEQEMLEQRVKELAAKENEQIQALKAKELELKEKEDRLNRILNDGSKSQKSARDALDVFETEKELIRQELEELRQKDKAAYDSRVKEAEELQRQVAKQAQAAELEKEKALKALEEKERELNRIQDEKDMQRLELEQIKLEQSKKQPSASTLSIQSLHPEIKL